MYSSIPLTASKIMWYFSEDEIQYLKNNYPILGAVKCAEVLNRPQSAINSKAFRLGLRINCKTISQINRVYSPTKLNVNPNGFINIETIYHAYMLGFLWGDGNLYKPKHMISIQINKDDGKILEPIFMNTGKWLCNYYNKRELTHKPYCRFLNSNKALYNFLETLSYTDKSVASHKLPLLHIPEKWRYLWLRGYIDADGCFCKGKGNHKSFELTSSYQQDWDYLLDYFKLYDINLKINRRIRTTGKNSSLVCNTFKDIYNLGKLIYPTLWDGIGLERKYLKWQLIINSTKQKPINLNL